MMTMMMVMRMMMTCICRKSWSRQGRVATVQNKRSQNQLAADWHVAEHRRTTQNIAEHRRISQNIKHQRTLQNIVEPACWLAHRAATGKKMSCQLAGFPSNLTKSQFVQILIWDSAEMVFEDGLHDGRSPWPKPNWATYLTKRSHLVSASAPVY